ncbi:MAG: ABC-F family ATP-binding cassette domain-containing protein [Acidobacteria bacterium]|uniref:ABC-F family ATP-binding cassette domain-containing protein n=1 Tax=Candidatus Polarisedimenticola svalbardensis TaxID=2886004 RepID=A0A8J7CEV1_9BACT|nr:ABC-F family ATP-binding cassette domain-containing protein [Candidatus Polarisedimenticola svalbardensis]
MLQLSGVEKRFGAQVLFRDLSWMIPAGARLGLVGPNGTGKTTLLRMLSGEEPPDDGVVHRPRNLSVGYLAQEVETVGEGPVLQAVLDGAGESRTLALRLRELEDRLEFLDPGDGEGAEATAEYGELLSRFEQIGGNAVENRAQQILAGLGVHNDLWDRDLPTLSGGWRMRVMLARLLMGNPDLLLLDEPTNHLDLPAIDWLEGFLESYPGSFVVVSHDRYFLNRMVGSIVELERGRLTVWPGNYDAYLESKELREEQLEKAAAGQAREIARTERFIERFRYKNTKSKQVQSRVKALEKMDRIRTASSEKKIHFGFPPAPRSGDIVVRSEAMDMAYGETVVFTGLDLLLKRGDRVALVGPNGAGKSTLLKLMAGRLEPASGLFELGHNVDLQYFAQHQLEALDPKRTVLQEMEALVSPGMVQKLRNILGSFLFHGEDVDKKVGVLSGGEKARLALARMLLRPVNLLLLDEPTNHLDLRSREVLEEALNQYEGTLVLISHDRYFINRVADKVADVGAGGVELFDGDYDTWIERRSEKAGKPLDGDSLSSAVPDRGTRDRKRAEAVERNQLHRLRKEIGKRLDPVEREIAEIEQRVRELEHQQANPEVYQNPAAASRVAREKGVAEDRLETLYPLWERLTDEMP